MDTNNTNKSKSNKKKKKQSRWGVLCPMLLWDTFFTLGTKSQFLAIRMFTAESQYMQFHIGHTIQWLLGAFIWLKLALTDSISYYGVSSLLLVLS
jgi:hypothetical protein